MTIDMENQNPKTETPNAGTAPAPPRPQPAPPIRPAAPHHIKPKIGKNTIGCFVSIAVAVLAGLSIIALLVAKSGIVKIPFFSRFYTGPIPTRLISAKPITANQFKVLLSSRVFSAGIANKKPPLIIKLNEKEITGALETAIDAALRDEEWKQVFTQIAVRPTDFEMLSQFERGPFRFDVLLRFKPVIRGGGVSFDPVFAQIGDYVIPPSIAYNVLGYLFSRDLGTWDVKFGDLKLSDIKLFDAYLEAVISTSGAK